jgi:hypothetical protein
MAVAPLAEETRKQRRKRFTSGTTLEGSNIDLGSAIAFD